MLFNVKFPLPEFASRVLCLTASSRATLWTLVISKFIYTETPLAQSSRTWCCITWGNAALLLNPPLFIPGCSPKPWLLRNKEHVLLLTFFSSPNPSWLYSFRGCQHPGIHLFFRLHSPAVLSVPEVVHDPKSCFNLLRPFFIPQYPRDMCKGFICSLALWWVGNPLTSPLSGLAVFYKFLVVLILDGTRFISPGSDQMGIQMETDVAPVNGLFDREESGSFRGLLLPRGENCCIIHGAYFRCKLLSHGYRSATLPSVSSPGSLALLCCSFAEVRCASLKTSGRKYPIRTRTGAPGAPTTSGVADEWGSPPLFCVGILSHQQRSWFYFHV